MRKLVILIACAAVFSACDDTPKKKYKPGSIGALNTVAVVMPNAMWEGAVGDKVREHFAAPLIGLTWDEPRFNLEHMPPSVFTGTTRHRRSVLYVSRDSVTGAQVQSDLYASPQMVGVVKGTSDSAIMAAIETHAGQIIDSIRTMEMEEAQERFRRSLSKETIFQDKFGVTLRLPSIYKVGKQEENFVWIDREIQKGSMNIIAYEMPGDSFDNDSTFVRDIVRMRDSIGKLYIPGPDVPGKVTYMGTEKAFAPSVFPAEVGGKPAAEVRGIWEIVNYPMAGPFLTYIINDPENNRKLVLEGFTFAPATNKRDYMFELEAILRTVRFGNSPADSAPAAK
ncbi:DUF4837 family protein [Robiginitalea biformata]|uniref:DUF4837 domain-containing protein n=1 Tax=Robiginitalea biformata (strain ATCC BAA-864 / DSM 15991 / KCTC 12146 / HTCC2501) TaxID=313596 RepID=A4CI26_ROBBH|nr:DUF4837 family protein [Robiginitalea biformata]EAR16584.1 hypothetical protein RB2501_06780 [Robiginitalea biformata HTCC2501]